MPICEVCDTRFLGASFDGPAEPCDCEMNLSRSHVLEGGEAAMHRALDLRRTWITAGRSWPVRCDTDDCTTPFNKVQNYYAGSEWERTTDPLMLCDDCRQRQAEDAWQASCDGYYGGGGTSDTQRSIAAQRLK